MTRFAMPLLCALLLAALAPGNVHAEDLQFGKFKARTQDGTLIQGVRGRIAGDRFHATTAEGPLELSVADIRVLDIRSGHEGRRFAGIGALCGGLVAVVSMFNVARDPELELREDRVVPVTATLVGLGTLIGFALGSGQSQWSRVPLSPAAGAEDGGSMALSWGFSF